MGVCVCVCEVVKWDISTVHHIILLYSVVLLSASTFSIAFSPSIPQFLDSSIPQIFRSLPPSPLSFTPLLRSSFIPPSFLLPLLVPPSLTRATTRGRFAEVEGFNLIDTASSSVPPPSVGFTYPVSFLTSLTTIDGSEIIPPSRRPRRRRSAERCLLRSGVSTSSSVDPRTEV